MDRLPWSRSGPLQADHLALLDRFVLEVQARFTAQLGQRRDHSAAQRTAVRSGQHEFSFPDAALPRDTLSVEVMLQLLLSFFFDTNAVPTVLPFGISQVHSLARMAAAQGRITAHVVAAVATRPIATLHDLEKEVCVSEGVEAFHELGFGHQIHCLPVVQQYFKLPPSQPHMPVSGTDVVAFLCRDKDARERLLQAQGDARDVVNAFAHWYGNTHNTTVHNRQLGVHIQSLPAFQMLLRQYASNAMTAAEDIVRSARTQFDRNALLYMRVVEALDAHLAEIPAATALSRSPLVCDVHMSEVEAEDTSVPRRFWSNAPRDDGRGGLRLTLSTAAPAVRATTGLPRACDRASASVTNEAVSHSEGHAASTNVAATMTAKLPGVSARRRGRVIVDTAQVPATSLSTSPPCVVEPFTTGSTSTAGFGFGPLGLAAPLAAPTTTTPSVGEHASAALAQQQSSLAVSDSLVDCLALEDRVAFAERAIDVLSAICVGDTVQKRPFTDVFVRLAKLVTDTKQTGGLRQEEEALSALMVWCRSSAFIPLAKDAHAREACSERGGLVSSRQFVVRDVASPEEVYMPRAATAALQDDVASWLSRTTDGIFAEMTSEEETALADFFTHELRVSPVPTLRCWVAAALARKRDAHLADLHDISSTQMALDALECCVTCELAEQLLITRGDAAQALQCILNSVPREEAMSSAVFPVHGMWRRGRADLFFAGPSYTRYNGSCSLSSRVATAPSLLVLPFRGEPHFAVSAVLEHFGVRPLEAWVVKTVRLETMAFVETALAIHRQVQLVLPAVQAYLSTKHAALYRLVEGTVRRRLQSFRVVLGRGATLHVTMPYHNTEYALTRSFPLLYVPQHNTLYGEDSACTPHVLAETLAALFLPLTPDVHVVEGLREVLRGLFSVITSASGGLLSEEHMTELEHRVAVEAEATFGVTCHAVTDGAAWSLSAAPFVRFQPHFPPGTDGFSSPAPFHRPSTTLASQGLCPRRGPQGAHPADKGGREQDMAPDVASLLVTFSPHCAEKQWARSLPQWQNPLYAEHYDALQDLLREDRAAVQRDALKVAAGLFTTVRGAAPDSEDGVTHVVADAATAATADAFLGFGSCEPFPGSKRTRDMQVIGRQPGRHGQGSYRGSDESTAAVASEAFVYQQLVEQYAAEDPAVEVLWVNEHAERGTPYDILIVRRRGPRETPNVIAFVEVKSTTQAHRADFEMSLRELLFAARYGTAYRVYRVFKASASHPEQMRIHVLSDVVTMWHTGKLTMTGEVRVMTAQQGQGGQN